MAGTAEPPFTQQELLYVIAHRLETLTEDGKVRPQVTATQLGLGPNGTQRIQRLLKGEGTLHWDEAWRLYTALGWINEPAVLRDVQKARRDAARAQAHAAELKAQGVRERQRRGA